MEVFMPLNSSAGQCNRKRFLNDEVQCQHACSKSNDCSLVPNHADGGAAARKKQPLHYFAPGTIQGSSDMQAPDAGWVWDVTLEDCLGAIAALIIIGAICGYLS
jgi:hypothetical protein